MKGPPDNYSVVATYPLIDQLTINGQKKFIKQIQPKNLAFDRLILIVPNTTFGQNFKPLSYNFKLFRGPQVNFGVNTSVPGRVKFTGEGFGSEALVHFEAAGDKEYTTAYGTVVHEGDLQSVEVDLPPDAVNGKLFISTQGFSTNEMPYTLDVCKKDREFSTASSIQEFVKCLY